MKKLIWAIVVLFTLTVQAQEVTIEELQEDFVTPQFQADYLGMSWMTKSNLEESLQVTRIMHRGGKDFYNIADKNVTIEYSPEDVCIYVSFRLFAEEAEDYEKELRKVFTLQQTRKGVSLETEANRTARVGQVRIRKYRKGEVVCEVYDGTYIGFSYYTVKLK